MATQRTRSAAHTLGLPVPGTKQYYAMLEEAKRREQESKVSAFEAGKTYTTKSICDSDCIYSITITSRTAKTIKTTEGKTLRISIYDGYETVKPFGAYSMCPIIRAKSV